MRNYLKFEYFYIVLILIWLPLNTLVLKFDGAGRSIFLLTLIIILRYFKKREIIKIVMNPPLFIYGIWVLYAFINRLINGNYHDDLPILSFFTLISTPFFLMVIINYCAIKNFERTINVLIFGMYFSLAIALIFSFRTVFYDREVGDINSNTIGISSIVLVMLLYLKFYNKKFSTVAFLLFSLIPVIIILTTETRTAFGGLILLIIAHFLIHRSKGIINNILKYVVSLTFLLILLNIIFYNTSLGERILSTTEQAEEAKDLETGIPVLDKFGDRGIFYYLGWQLFMKNPILGVGLNNYIIYTDQGQEQHSEYMIQLAELGIIGFLIFISFYISIFKNLLNIKKIIVTQKNIEIYSAYIVIILMMITVTRMYNAWNLFPIVGIVTGYITKEKYARIKLCKRLNKVRQFHLL